MLNTNMENKENQNSNESQREKFDERKFSRPFNKISSRFNPNAEPFEPRKEPIIRIGPTNISVNANIWSVIASDERSNPAFNTNRTTLHPTSVAPQLPPRQSVFQTSNSRQIVFHRDFGPVATADGLELRLNKGARIFLSLDDSILIDNGLTQIAVNMKTQSCALVHPMGRLYKKADCIDIVAFDGCQRNDFIRFAKILKDSIVFTSTGCVLNYKVDQAGMRTSSSEKVNRDWTKDYCRIVYEDGVRIPQNAVLMHASSDYRYKIDADESDIFVIRGIRIVQSKDGMIRVMNEHFSIRASIESRSVTLKLNDFYCTASLGETPHLFIRNMERRIHFDGCLFNVRNMGHSAIFDERNQLRVR